MGDELYIEKNGSSRKAIQSASNMPYTTVLAAIVARGSSEFCPLWTTLESKLKCVNCS